MKATLLLAFLACAAASATAAIRTIQLDVFSSNPYWSANQLAPLVWHELSESKAVSIVRENPQYRVRCTAIPLKRTASGGYAVSIVFLSADGRFLADVVREYDSIEGLAHDIAHVIEAMISDMG
jgi:hypothetical protein